ncbi:phospholipase A2 [Pseudonocardia nematodicida]|uniref:Phospholipase A2 n=1 Tax=Pseudonocardia nematodicida TaxID=1206997 RepID=A0ABV1KCY5_9PSEU
MPRTTLRRRLAAFSAATAAALALAVTVAAPAQAAQSDPLRDEARRIMSMDYQTFVDHKANVAYPTAFNWTDDGCSGPQEVRWIYRDLFEKACEQHDFGYRNYGLETGGLHLGPNEDTRAWIDRRFSEEMRRTCARSFSKPWQTYNRIFCDGQAAHVFAAVRNAKEAKDSFYS